MAPLDVDELHRDAERGSVVASGVLGMLYLYGCDVGVDYEKALGLLTFAASRGASRPMLNLGYMHAKGLGVPVDLRKAAELFERAAERGEFLAMIEIARAYLNGAGVPVDPGQAMEWYRAAVLDGAGVEDCDELREAKAHVERADRRDT